MILTARGGNQHNFSSREFQSDVATILGRCRGYLSTGSGKNDHQKRTPEWILFKTGSFSFTNGQTKTEVTHAL